MTDENTSHQYGVLTSIAERFRRLRGDETYDENGVRTIWHRGPQRTELLTWENRDGGLVKQEFSFAGLLVEFTPEHGMRTGIIPLSDQVTDTGQPRSTVIRMQATVEPTTLAQAARLLGFVSDRDYYGQHLMELSNDWLIRNGHKPVVPQSSSAENFNRAPMEDDSTWRTITGLHDASGTTTVPLPVIALAGIILGVALGLLLF